MPGDDRTYGFNKNDAVELVNLIGNTDSEFVDQQPSRGGGIRVFVGELNEAWSTGVAECSIYSMDGMTLTDTGIDADVYDPLEVFAVLGTGDRLYVTRQSGKYYAANNAPCPAGE